MPTTHTLALAPVATTKALDWNKITERLKKELGEDVYASWFARLALDGIEGGIAHLSVPTRFLKSWIQSHYMDRLKSLMASEDGTICNVQIAVRSAEVKPNTDAANKQRPASLQTESAHQRMEEALRPTAALAKGGALNPADASLSHASPLDKRYTFETFFQGKSNAMACAAAQQLIAAEQGRPAPFNPLYLHSNVGLGKTHLAQALANALEAKGQRVVYLTAERFMFGFVSSLRTHTAMAFKEALRGIDVLIVDDIQFLSGKSIQSEFGHTLNALIENCRQIVIAADRPPSALENVDDRIRSRLAGGLVVEIGALDEDLRRQIVKNRIELARQKHAGFTVPNEVVEDVVASITSNGRDLDGAVNRLLAQAMLTDAPITRESAEMAIRDLVKSADTRRIKIEDIQRIVSQHYNVSRADLLSARRNATVVKPRQVAIYLSKVLTLRSLPEIGRRFGGRDHTTVLHAVRKIEGLMVRDHALNHEVEHLKRLIQTI